MLFACLCLLYSSVQRYYLTVKVMLSPGCVLQGHEDLRQDERVMQLFGLVNTMLANDRTTAERDLSIARYAVIPLSPNSGLIGWVSSVQAAFQGAGNDSAVYLPGGRSDETPG